MPVLEHGILPQMSVNHEQAREKADQVLPSEVLVQVESLTSDLETVIAACGQVAKPDQVTTPNDLSTLLVAVRALVQPGDAATRIWEVQGSSAYRRSAGALQV